MAIDAVSPFNQINSYDEVIDHVQWIQSASIKAIRNAGNDDMPPRVLAFSARILSERENMGDTVSKFLSKIVSSFQKHSDVILAVLQEIQNRPNHALQNMLVNVLENDVPDFLEQCFDWVSSPSYFDESVVGMRILELVISVYGAHSFLKQFLSTSVTSCILSLSSLPNDILLIRCISLLSWCWLADHMAINYEKKDSSINIMNLILAVNRKRFSQQILWNQFLSVKWKLFAAMFDKHTFDDDIWTQKIVQTCLDEMGLLEPLALDSLFSAMTPMMMSLVNVVQSFGTLYDNVMRKSFNCFKVSLNSVYVSFFLSFFLLFCSLSSI